MGNVVKDKSYMFALDILKTCQYLIEVKKEFVLSKQLMRAGTSIGSNVREALNAESRSDFIHKMKIAQKECDETLYWLELLSQTNYIDPNVISIQKQNASELLKILKSIILTTKQKS
ncbi:MAG: four helix bundle protein [Bacillota bacterium]